MREAVPQDPAELRMKAAECRRAADKAIFPADRNAFARMAEEYAALAAACEILEAETRPAGDAPDAPGDPSQPPRVKTPFD